MGDNTLGDDAARVVITKYMHYWYYFTNKKCGNALSLHRVLSNNKCNFVQS